MTIRSNAPPPPRQTEPSMLVPRAPSLESNAEIGRRRAHRHLSVALRTQASPAQYQRACAPASGSTKIAPTFAASAWHNQCECRATITFAMHLGEDARAFASTRTLCARPQCQRRGSARHLAGPSRGASPRRLVKPRQDTISFRGHVQLTLQLPENIPLPEVCSWRARTARRPR